MVNLDWKEAETGEIDQDDELSPESFRVPGLTILAHPLSRRIGERITLPALVTGGQVRLSRLEPEFFADRENHGLPLADHHLSRRPILLTHSSKEDGVTLLQNRCRMPTQINGEPLVTRRHLSSDDIRRGVVLELGRCVVLLLHLQRAITAQIDLPDYGLVGCSSPMTLVRQDIHQAAQLDLPVLLRGETGTGKELVARAIHQSGPRRRRPFVSINMGAIPPALAASELFGSTRGAFTGAHRRKDGFFRHAQGGTLFLDEIGETPVEVQGLLLRALESGEIQPVGSVDHQAVDVRIIAATDAQIEPSLPGGQFRGPLYHRLAGFRIKLPPLRDRREDIGLLLRHFYFIAQREAGHSPARFLLPAPVIARLAEYHWPGNVRELRNLTRRLALSQLNRSSVPLMPLLDDLLESPEVSPSEGLPAVTKPGQGDARPPSKKFRKPDEVSEAELLAALSKHRWCLKPTAKELEVSRATLYRLIESCSQIRKATEIGRFELAEALVENDGDIVAAAARLRVSSHGLKIQMKALNLS